MFDYSGFASLALAKEGKKKKKKIQFSNTKQNLKLERTGKGALSCTKEVFDYSGTGDKHSF